LCGLQSAAVWVSIWFEEFLETGVLAMLLTVGFQPITVDVSAIIIDVFN